ncbi:MAG: hypothetical protein AB8C46_12265 [Burkholderiaceae bacterium]
MKTSRPMRPLIALSAGALLLTSSLSFGQSLGDPLALRCEFQSTERSLTVVYPELAEGGGCRVVYEKPDEGIAPRVLWRATNDLAFCDRKLNTSADKLVASGWSCSQRDNATAYSLTLAAALPGIEARAAEKAAGKAADAAPATPAASSPAVAQSEPALPAKEAMSTPDADRVLPEKSTAATIAAKPNTAEPQKKTVIAKAPAVSPASSLVAKSPAPAKATNEPTKQALATGRTKTNEGEYDDWLFRWDEISKQLVFTLYNSKDGTKVHNFSWAHEQMDESAASPSNIVLAQDEYANQVLIIAWPGKDSQHITVLDPLVKERPVCEIETLSKRDSDWGYGVEEKKLFLKGYKPSDGDPKELVEFREQCTYIR